MVINQRLTSLLDKPFDVVNSKAIASAILEHLGLTNLEYLYTQNSSKKISDTTKKGMFIDDDFMADKKAAFDILNNQFVPDNKLQQLIIFCNYNM